jgi:hypothetical protein
MPLLTNRPRGYPWRAVSTLAADHNGGDEFGPYGELLELTERGGPAWKRENEHPTRAAIAFAPEVRPWLPLSFDGAFQPTLRYRRRDSRMT